MNITDRSMTTDALARPISNGMKVLIFSTAYFPFVGGAEVAVKELTDRLGSGIRFDLITARLNKDLPKAERIGKVNVYRIGFGIPLFDKLLLPFVGAVKTLKLQRRNHYNAYWCIMASFASGAAYIANWFQKKVPIILTLQEGDSESWLKYRWLGLINLSWRLALQRTQVLTAISTYLLERARKLGFKGRAELVPNGVNIRKFHNPGPRSQGEEVILITTSRLVEKNGIGDVIEAMKFLPGNVKFRILGTGPLEKNLKLRVEKLNLEKRIEFLGFVNREDIPQHLHKAYIFVRPSLSEGQGISFIEAMAAGLPVIATSVGGIVDFLKDKETGLFCKVNDPKSIADKVAEYTNNPEMTERIVKSAKEMVTRKYDWGIIAGDMRTKIFSSL